jgi:metalloendopeptidase OMA1, mitochondrial
VGHAIARHGAERISATLLSQLGQIALNLIVDVDDPIVLDALNKAYGLSTEIGVKLPFSRKQELEADRIGVSLMNEAGYNPLGALEFWKRMKHERQGKEPMVYLSTHPVDDKRIAQIEQILQNQNVQK